MIAIFESRVIQDETEKAARIEMATARADLRNLIGSIMKHKRFATYSVNAKLFVFAEVFDKEHIFIHKVLTSSEMREKAESMHMSIEDMVRKMVAEGTDNLEGEAKMEIVDKSDPLFGYFINQETRLAFNTIHQMCLRSPAKPVKALMMGPSGYGKTMTPELFAKLTGRRYFRMNCPSVRDPEEWFGWREAKDGSTVFVPSKFIEMVTEGHCVIVLDEFNRLEPWLHNTLYPLLDDAAATEIHDQRFAVGEDVIFVATINTGYRYTGTFELDEALANRFNFFIEVKPMQERDEVKVLCERTGIEGETATQIVKTANILRGADINCSTRTSLDIAEQVSSGMTVREAFEFSVIRRIPQSSDGGGQRKQALDLINTKIGHFTQRILSADVFGLPVAAKAVEVSGKAVLTLMRMPVAEYLNINVIKVLRGLPVKNSSESMSLRDAKTLAEKLVAGETVYLELSKVPDDISSQIEILRRSGVDAKLSKGE